MCVCVYMCRCLCACLCVFAEEGVGAGALMCICAVIMDIHFRIIFLHVQVKTRCMHCFTSARCTNEFFSVCLALYIGVGGEGFVWHFYCKYYEYISGNSYPFEHTCVIILCSHI